MMKNKVWNDQEDDLLLELYDQINCFQRWKVISQKFKEKGINKTQIECRQRFFNKLDPSLKHQKVEPNQIRTIFTLYSEYGPLWSSYQSLIPGRNQNMIKNTFYSTLRSLIRLIVLCGSKNNFPFEKTPTLKLSSKNLVQIYDGKREFKKFKAMIRKSMKIIKYDVDAKRVEDLKNQLDLQMLQGFMEALKRAKIIKGKAKHQLKTPLKVQQYQQSKQISSEKAILKEEEVKVVVNEEKTSQGQYSFQQMPNFNPYPFYGMGNMPQQFYPLWVYPSCIN